MVSLITLDVAGTTVNERGAVYDTLKSVVEEALCLISDEDLHAPPWAPTRPRRSPAS